MRLPRRRLPSSSFRWAAAPTPTNIPLAAGESVTDIRYLANGAEFSLMDTFELTPGTGGVTATYLPKLDFSAFLGQTISLKVVKTGAAFSAQSEEQLLLKIVSAQDLQHDLKLVAVTEGTPQADALEFVISGAVNAALSDLVLVGIKGDTSVKALLTLNTGRGGDISAGLREADLDTFADKPLELRAVKTLKGSSAALTQKLTIALTTAKTFTQDATLTTPTSGDKQPDPFTLDLAAGANIEVNDITLDQPGGAVSVLDLFTLIRAVDGGLSAKLKADLDLDAYLDQAPVLHVQMSVAGRRYTRTITLNLQAPDRPTLSDAPKLVAKDDAGLSIANAISDPDGVRDVLYILYRDAAGKTEAARNSSGAFTGLSANTAYYAGTTAETLDRATRKWTAQASPLLPLTTDQAMPAAFSFNAVSGAGLNAQLTSNAITVSGLHGTAAVSVTGGEYVLNGGAWTDTAGTVNNGQTVQVRGTAASGYSTVGKVTLTIGGRSADFTMTTIAAPVVVYYNPPLAAPTDSAASWNGEVACSVDINTLNGTQIDLNAASGVVTCTLPTISDADGTGTRTANINGTPYTVTGGQISIDPAVLGVGTFTLTVSGAGVQKSGSITNLSSLANKVYTVDVVNSPPTASDYTHAPTVGPTGVTLNWKTLMNAQDADAGDTLTATVLTNGAKGTAVITDSSGVADANGNYVTFTPNAGQTGADAATLHIEDGHGGSVDKDIILSAIDTVAPTATPTVDILPGTFGANQTLTFSCPVLESGCTMRYTTDGSVPNSNSPLLNAPITVTGVAGASTTTTIKVLEFDAAGNPKAAPDSFVYVVDKQAPGTGPTPDIAPGIYGADQTVTLTPPEAGSKLYYTTDGSAPTTSSPLYAAPISITGGAGSTTTTNLKVLTVDAVGNQKAAIDTFGYTIDKQAPTIGNVPDQTDTVGVAITPINVSTFITTTGTTPAYTLTGAPPGITIHATTGIISGTPNGAPGSFTATISYSDENSSAPVTDTVDWTIN